MQQSISHPNLQVAILFAVIAFKKYVKLTDDWLHLALHNHSMFLKMKTSA